MESFYLVGTTDGAGVLSVVRRIPRPMRLVKVKWLSGDLVDGVDATVKNLGMGTGIAGFTVPDRTLLTLTDANIDGWYDISETGGGVVDSFLRLDIANGGAYKSGGIIAYLDPDASAFVANAPANIVGAFAQQKLFDNSGVAIGSANPLEVRQEALTYANDVVAAQGRVYDHTSAAWVVDRQRNILVKEFRSTALANNATFTPIVAPGAGVRWRLHQYELNSSVAGAVSLEDALGTNQGRHILAVNVPRLFPVPGDGLLASAANVPLYIKNTTGSPADISVNVWYSLEAG